MPLDALVGKIRADILDAHNNAWDWISRPGTWLTGEERCATVREARNTAGCTLCHERKEALSPNAVSGSHDSLGELDDANIDAIHRIVTDSGRLSESWYQGLLESGMSEGSYVETAGLVAMTMMMDAFCWATDVPPSPVPNAQVGEPTPYRPPGAKQNGAWVPTVLMDDVSPSDGDLYGGSAGGVHQALSLVPDSKRAFWALGEPHYIPMTEIRNPDTQVRAISRAQIEILASRVSALHQCLY